MSKVLSLIFLNFVFHSTVQANTCDSVGAFAWILGSWNSESSRLKISESWKQISNKTFEGSGLTYSIEKNEIVSSETLRLVEMSGEIFYIAKVASNDLPIAFKLISCTAETAVFENSQHDFPKKLSYRLTKDKNITVFVSGENGKGFSIEFVGENDS